MAKTRRASKSNTRAKRQARSKASRESRREAVATRAAERRLDEMFGAETPPRRSAELIMERFGARGVLPAGMSRFFIVESSVERARDVAQAVTELAPESMCALTLAADVAMQLDRDDLLASSLIDRALKLTDEDDDRATLADYLVRLGRAADALAIVEDLHPDDPMDEDLEATRAAALTLAWQRAGADADDEDVRPDECPCGSGLRWPECCQPVEAAAIERFTDRTNLANLQSAIARYVEGERALRAVVADDVRRCSEAASIAGEAVSDPDEVKRIAAEHGWLIGVEDRDPEPGQRSEPDSSLALFAREPTTPQSQTMMARRWLESCSYGLWQVREPIAKPGVWLTELVTGVMHYAALPPELLARTSRWSVLLGALVAVDGTWRPGAGMLLLRPGEADEAADLVQELTYKVVSSASGKPLRRPAGSELGSPHGVIASVSEPSSPEVTRFVSMVTGSGLSQLLAYLAEARSAQPKLVNTDKHTMVLINATIAVNDVAEVTAQLAKHPEFDVEDGVIKWWGRELDTLERETSLAELRAWLKERGEDPSLAVDPEGSQRWLRGSIRVGPDGLEVDVNSRERFERLLGFLTDAGGAPHIVKKLVVDPAQDMALPHLGSVLSGSGSVSDEAAEAWRRHWPDQKLPALGGMTPRQAARSEHRKPWLEAMLRELEHDADRLARQGRPAPNINALRVELDMPITAFS